MLSETFFGRYSETTNIPRATALSSLYCTEIGTKIAEKCHETKEILIINFKKVYLHNFAVSSCSFRMRCEIITLE